ncbi:YjjG family noncanonical pyrimidine nucleotidase [Hyunsoonleella sp. 2307UL5-6]|uniref:YjjG family noncanonical pyrimidine nucleotidase n=1 Tax=Hyunsoonleella sp. 2307UL5-6 TaxID=3384768 RepID=UPI0039BD6A29
MNTYNTITDVFFDLDHTLWDFEKNSGLAFEKIFRINKIDVDLATFIKKYSPINFQYWKLYREEKISKENLRFSRLNDTFKALGVTLEKEQINKLSDDYILHLASFNYLLDGAIDTLNYLKNKYRLHIITNGFNEVQHSKLNKSNILKYFQTITNSELAGVKKPNPIIFNYALNLAKVEVENTVMIGDSYEADIEGALNVGMQAIFYDPKQSFTVDSVNKVSHLTQLKNIL